MPRGMIYSRCQCGHVESWSSMGQPPCRECAKCHTTLATSPSGHRRAESHHWLVTPVDTDGGGASLTVCGWCGITKAEHDAKVAGGTVLDSSDLVKQEPRAQA